MLLRGLKHLRTTAKAKLSGTDEAPGILPKYRLTPLDTTASHTGLPYIQDGKFELKIPTDLT